MKLLSELAPGLLSFKSQSKQCAAHRTCGTEISLFIEPVSGCDIVVVVGQQQTLSFSFSRVKSLVLNHLHHQDFCKQTRMEQNNLRTHYLKEIIFYLTKLLNKSEPHPLNGSPLKLSFLVLCFVISHWNQRPQGHSRGLGFHKLNLGRLHMIDSSTILSHLEFTVIHCFCAYCIKVPHQNRNSHDTSGKHEQTKISY